MKLSLQLVESSQGDVDSVVTPASEGEMGILPMHVPVLTALSPGELRIGNDGREERLVVGNGFAEIAHDHVRILGFAELSEDLKEQLTKLDQSSEV